MKTVKTVKIVKSNSVFTRTVDDALDIFDTFTRDGQAVAISGDDALQCYVFSLPQMNSKHKTVSIAFVEYSAISKADLIRRLNEVKAARLRGDAPRVRVE